MHGMADALRTQAIQCLPDAVRTVGFAGMHSDVPAGLARAFKMRFKPSAREVRLVAGQIQPANVFPLAEQSLQFLPSNLRAVGAAEDADQPAGQIKILAAGLYPFDHCLHHRGRVQMMRFGHKQRAEAQFDVIDSLLAGIFHAFISHPAASVCINQHAGHPFKTGDECHNARLRFKHLDVRAQPLHIPGWQRQIVFAAQIEDSLEPQAAVEVAVKVNERQR